MRVRWLAGVVAIGAAVVLSGCGAGSPGSGAAAALGLAPQHSAPDPCGLLNRAQQRQLGVSPGVAEQRPDALGGKACSWRTVPATRDSAYYGWLVSGSVSGASAPAPSIGGFNTVQLSPGDLDPDRHCVYLVDVTPDQHLWVQFSNANGDVPGMNHQIACRKAQAAASAMASTFRSLPQ